jgi:hypothetical protein
MAAAQDAEPVSRQTWRHMCEAFDGVDPEGLCSADSGADATVSPKLMLADAAPVARPRISDRWSVSFAPYIWLAAVDTEITTDSGAPRNASAESNVDFADVLEELDFAFLGHLEARKQRWALFADAIYMRISSNGQTNAFSIGPLAVSPTNIDVEIETTILEFGVAYRVAEWQVGSDGANAPTVALELLGGGRFISLDVEAKTAIELTGPLGIISRQIKLDLSPTIEFVDPIIGARLFAEIGPRWRLGLRGDVGGFGLGSEFTWNMVASATYRAWDNVDLLFGYRAMSIDLEDDDPRLNIDLDLTLHGPLIAAAFHW